MKGFRYHHEFWMDFHFWILVLLLVVVTLTMQTPLSVVSLAYLAFVGILILLQVFQPPVSTRQYPEGAWSRCGLFWFCVCRKGKSDSKDGLVNRKNEDL